MWALHEKWTSVAGNMSFKHFIPTLPCTHTVPVHVNSSKVLSKSRQSHHLRHFQHPPLGLDEICVHLQKGSGILTFWHDGAISLGDSNAHTAFWKTSYFLLSAKEMTVGTVVCNVVATAMEEQELHCSCWNYTHERFLQKKIKNTMCLTTAASPDLQVIYLVKRKN